MRPLDGIRVLDLSRLLPGGYATLVLADLGADVLKVEQPGRGDYVRSFPPHGSDGESAPHAALNRGKRSISLDLSTPDGAAVLRELARTWDVVVESFRPGVMDRLGLGYEALRAANPAVVYAAISGYGATGPRSGDAGHDINYLALAGVLGLSGTPGDGPWQPAVQVADVGGGALPAVIAILAALRVRDRTGLGQFCDVSMTDGARSWLLLQVAAHALTRVSPRPGADQLSGGLACYRVYRCADGRHVAVGALEPAFFATLVDVLGLPELRPWHLDPDRQAELTRRIAAVFATRGRDEWAAAFTGRDACVTPVLDLGEALADESAPREEPPVGDDAARQGDGGPVPTGRPGAARPAVPVLPLVPRLSETPAAAGGRAPALGEHTDEVLASLGRTPAEIADLRARGVV